MFDFFISYRTIDRNEVIDSFIHKLTQSGFTIWEDNCEIYGGDLVNSSIHQGLQNSYCLLMIVTPNYFDSNWTTWEFASFSVNQKKRIIPVFVNVGSEVKNSVIKYIGNIKCFEYVMEKEEDLFAELKKALIHTKEDNRLIVSLDKLGELKKQLNARENIKDSSIGLLLDEYLNFVDNHQSYVVSAAKKVISTVVCDVSNQLNPDNEIGEFDYIDQEKFVKSTRCFGDNIKENLLYFYRVSERLNSNQLVIVNEAIGNILTWYIKYKYPVNLRDQDFEIVWPTQMKVSDFDDMYEIDKLVLRDDLIADAETTFAWYQYNNYTHIALRDSDTSKIIGYFTLLPITDEAYDEILKGDFKDKDFNADSIVQYSYPGFYRIYIAAVAIHPDYQNSSAFLKLYNALIDLILYIAEKMEAIIYEIVAEASTKQGEKLCKMIGMKKVTRTLFETDIYTLNLIPPEFRIRNKQSKELMRLCKSKYLEYREEFEH